MLLTALALLCAHALSILVSNRLPRYAFREIEGLRGLLAFFVFIHHAYVWRLFLLTGEWARPASHLYSHLGLSSVAVFFMITAFLFTGKMIDRSSSMEWPHFAIARVMRLMPAYLLAVLVVLALVAVRSGFELLAPPFQVARYALQWFALGVLGTPDVNNVAQTGQMIAYVAWSLPFEVLFYLALPIAGVLAGQRPRRLFAAVSVIGMGFILYRGMDLVLLLAFLPGILAAFVVRNERVRALFLAPIVSWAWWLLLVLGIWRSSSFFDPLVFVGLSGLFVSIACGNSLFGLLRTQGADLLGQISYSVYLFHGLVLYIAINLWFGADRVRMLSSLQYWFGIGLLSPLLILVSFTVFRWVESPGIAAGRRLTERLARRAKIEGDPEQIASSRTAS